MDETKTTQKNDAELGLSLNKKTMLAITLVLVAILVFVGVLTQVLQRGEYDMTTIDGHEAIVNGTYHEMDYKMEIWKIALSPILCFTSSQATTGIAIILIIFFIGGSFLILDKVGVLQYIMASLIHRFQNRKYLLMAIVIFVCMALSSTAGILAHRFVVLFYPRVCLLLIILFQKDLPFLVQFRQAVDMGCLNLCDKTVNRFMIDLDLPFRLAFIRFRMQDPDPEPRTALPQLPAYVLLSIINVRTVPYSGLQHCFMKGILYDLRTLVIIKLCLHDQPRMVIDQ